MNRTVEVSEHRPSDPVRLTVDERDALRAAVSGLTVEPEPGETDVYRLKAGSTVGVIQLGDLVLEFRPKVGLAPVLFMVSYALNPEVWRRDEAPLGASASFAEALVALFSRHVRAATKGGLLHGYVSEDDSLTTIRGRVRMSDQMRQRRGLALPVEVRYDEFTTDVLENQVIRTAVDHLRRIPLRSNIARRHVAQLHQLFNGISTVDPRCIPAPHWTRLNQHYRSAVDLAVLVLTGGLEARAGRVRAHGVLLDMNAVFENFVREALREALGLTATEFPSGRGGRRTHLDDCRRIPLEPDLSWWRGQECVFVGDCKYKRVTAGIPNGDVYQMLAYLTAHRLDHGLLIFAAGDEAPERIEVSSVGKAIDVAVVDVAVEPAVILQQVQRVAWSIRASMYAVKAS